MHKRQIGTSSSIGPPFAAIGRSGVASARPPSRITAAILTFYVSRLGICEHNMMRMTRIADWFASLSVDQRWLYGISWLLFFSHFFDMSRARLKNRRNAGLSLLSNHTALNGILAASLAIGRNVTSGN